MLEGFPLGKIIKQNTLLDLIVELVLGISNPFLQNLRRKEIFKPFLPISN